VGRRREVTTIDGRIPADRLDSIAARIAWRHVTGEEAAERDDGTNAEEEAD